MREFPLTKEGTNATTFRREARAAPLNRRLPDPIRGASHEQPESNALTWHDPIRLRIAALRSGETDIGSSYGSAHALLLVDW